MCVCVCVCVHENDDIVNKTVLLLLCISDAKKWWGCKNLYDLIDKEIKGKQGVKNMSDLTKQQVRKYKIDRERLIKGSKHYMYVRSDFRFNKINLVLKKEQSVVIPLLITFSAEKIKLQHKALKSERIRTDVYFFEQKVAVEVQEKWHTDTNQDKEHEKQK